MPSRIYHVTATLFFVVLTAMTALMCVHAPSGGLVFAGLYLFPDAGFTDGFLSALAKLGLGEEGRMIVLAAVGGLDIVVAGILVFALMFLGFGELPEQRESRGLYQSAGALLAATAGLTGLVSLAAGEATALLALQALLFAGLVVTYSTFDFGDVTVLTPERHLNRLIRGSAANQAAFTAQLLSLSRGRKVR
jgi:hypothetical protein